MYRRKVTLEEACDALGISADDYNKAERLINGHAQGVCAVCGAGEKV